MQPSVRTLVFLFPGKLQQWQWHSSVLQRIWQFKATRSLAALIVFFFFFYPLQFTVLFITIEKQCKSINDKNIQTAFRGLRHQRELQGRAAVRLTDLAVFMKKRQSVWLTLKQRKKKQTDAGDRLMVRRQMCERDSQRRSSNQTVNNLSADQSLTNEPLGLCSPLWWW